FGFPAVIGISNDITELQNSRKEIEKQEKYFWRTLNSIGDAVVTTDQAGNIIMLNPVAERMMGVKLSEVAGKPLCDYFMTTIGRNGDIVESPVSRTIQTRTNIPASEGAILKSYDGKNTYPITGVSSPILDEQENVLGAILVFRDITEETKRQEEIKGELANWEAATRLASIYPFRYNLVTNTNESGDKILEVWPHCDGKPCLPQDWIIPEDYPEWKQRYDEVACNKVAHVVVRYRAMQRGKMRHFLGFIQKPSASGEYLTGLIQDITSIVETQDKERVLQTMWTACVESMPVIMFIKAPNDDFRYRQCNANFAKFLGLKKEEIIGHNDEELLRHGVPEQCLSNDLQVIKEGKPFEFLETVYSCDGVEHHFRTVKVSTIGPDGEPVLIALSLDETEDYKRQQKMKEVLEDWENAAEVAHIASYRIDKSMNLLSHMDRVTDFWSFDENGNPVSAEEHLCPEDVVSYNEMYRCVFSGEQETATMLCHVPQPEGMRYLRLFIRRTTDQNDVVVSGLVQDVTEHIIEQKKREALLALWKKVIDTLPAIFFVKNADDDFRCLQINDKCCSMVGLKPEEIIGRTEFEFLPNPEEAWKNLEEDQEVMKSGKLFYCTETLQSASGVRTTCKTVKIPAVDEDGRRILIAMSQDITDEQELFESQKIISSALEKLFSSDDLEGDICSLLEDICNYLGFGYGFICRLDEETDMLRFFTSYHRKGLSPLLDTKKFCIGNASTHPWYREMENGNLDELLCFDFSDEQDIERARNYVPLIVALAKEKDIRGTYLKYVSLNGKPWGYVGFMTCGYALNTLSEQHKNLLCLTAHIVEMAITRKRTQDRLQFALEAAQTADKAKRFFLSSMSHEIRTPLNAMVGFTDLLKDPDLDHETRIDFLNSITESSNALLALLNNVLTLSKLVSGNYSLHPVWTVFEEVFYELDRDFRPAAKKKNLDLVFNFDSVPQLYLDRPCLNRILSCLVGNAIEFTQKGTVTVTVNYYPTTVEEGDLLLKVSDTGIGIIASDREKIFEPFVPLTSRMRGTFSSRRGTGLALPIVKKIVEIHGGRLELDSEIAKGTTFTILLPNIARHREEESANALLNEIRPAATAQEMKSIELHPAVLVVDDAQMVLDILVQMLSKYHISVSMAHSGKEALECLEHQSFDIILTDMLMPEMSGTELAQKIRSMSQYKSMKIYAMSTENESIMYDKKLFDKVLLKPIKRKALNEIIFGNGTDEQQNEQQDAKK
ncbi:MAG: PAS domain-containing protein, partial [Thermoguttaceae bacterium]|nr:PAS domain-containing protein [Thermoguttaceae bacterium]